MGLRRESTVPVSNIFRPLISHLASKQVPNVRFFC